MERTLTRTALLTGVSALALGLTACGAEDTASDAAASGSTAASSAAEDAMGSSSSAPSSGTGAAAAEPFGEGCAAVPADGEVQTEERAEPFPDGASGLHSIRVTAT